MGNVYLQIMQKAGELEKKIFGFLLELLAIPSFSAKEKLVVRRIEVEMKKAGFDETRVDGMGNVIGRVGSGRRLIAFDAHVDTVQAGDLEQWSRDPFQPRIENGRILGRGAADQKGGLASMIYAGKVIKDLGLNKDFTILFVGSVQEEDCEGLCWKYIVEKEKIRPELVVLTEPSGLNIYRGHRGRMEIEVAVRGRSCHGSAPERGDNAVYKIARIAMELERLNERLRADPFLGKGTVVVTEVASGSPSLCAVPDTARLHLDRRLTIGETRESALAEVRAAAAAAGVPYATVTVPEYRDPSHTGLLMPCDRYFPTWVLAADSPYLMIASDAYAKLFGKEPNVDKWSFSTNGVAILPAYGIPCFGLGPGYEAQAHAADEYCPVEHLTLATAFYSALVSRLNERE